MIRLKDSIPYYLLKEAHIFSSSVYYLRRNMILKGIPKFWYRVMNMVQMNILELYAILQYSVIVTVEIESKMMKLYSK